MTDAHRDAPTDATTPLDLGPADAVPVGGNLVVAMGTTGHWDDIAVFHTEDGGFHAVDDSCTHGDISLAEGELEGDTIECWLHGSSFCLRDGQPQCLPATEPIGVHHVEVRDGHLWLTVVDKKRR
ncbi:MAG: non-heme iron oxygenase ferredoxin subunit [Micrococcus sp.]|nr:non-heme iron oxygenase ferredoxin subunit [Micrococcus sp.]